MRQNFVHLNSAYRRWKLPIVSILPGLVLLDLLVWYAETRADGSNSDAVLGAFLYATLAVSLLTDAAYMLLSRRKMNNLSHWIRASETGLRLAALGVLIASLVFLPIPGFRPDFPLIFAIAWIIVLYVMEVGWRVNMLTRLGQQAAREGDGQLVAQAIAAHLVILAVVAAGGLGTAALISGLVYIVYGPLRMQLASIATLIIVPPVLLVVTFFAYRRVGPWLYTVNGRMLLLIASILPLLGAPSSLRDGGLTVTLRPEEAGYFIAPDFLGLSFEAPVLMGPAFESSNAQLIRLLRNLGTGTLRFGGNAVEQTEWQPDSVSSPTLGRTDLDRVFAFANKIRWRVILGLNLGHFDPVAAADEAAYAGSIGHKSLFALEIGNEPDLFMFNRERSPLWTYQDFQNEFKAYIVAIRDRYADAPIAGPVTYGDTGLSWFSQTLRESGAYLALATHHLYPLTRLPVQLWGTSAAPTIDNLLSASVMDHAAATVDTLVREAKANHLLLQISETNSVANSGKAGVSDTFAATLWGTDYLFTLAEHGVRGMNFHTVWRCYGYTPICFDGVEFRAQPLYYAMLVFHQVVQDGARTIPVNRQGSANVAAHAVISADGTLYVILINKEQHQAATVQLNNVPYTKASVLRLRAPAVDAQTAITFGGSSLNRLQTWLPSPEGQQESTMNFITLPPASAAVITWPAN